MTLSEPRPAPWISAEAAVSPKTARMHLDHLTELGVVTATETDGTQHYHPDPLYTRFRDVRELIRELSKQEITELAAEMEADIAGWKSEHDVGSPDTLRARAAADEISSERAVELTQTARDWDLTRYRLSLVQLAIKHYDSWTSYTASLAE